MQSDAILRALELISEAAKVIRTSSGSGRPATRELSLAITKLQEAEMWVEQHARVNLPVGG